MSDEDDPVPAVNYDIFREVVRGVMSVLTVTSSPLYRYPYRNSAEAFRGDFKRIGSDIESAMNQIQFGQDDGR